MPTRSLALRTVIIFTAGAMLAASTATAGLWDDLKEGLDAAGNVVDDVKQTREDAKGTYEEGKGVVSDTGDDLGVQGGSAPPPPPSASTPPPPSASNPPPPPSARQWHLDDGQGGTRQVTEAHLVQMIRSGAVDASTPIYGGGLQAWTAAGEVPALASHFRRP